MKITVLFLALASAGAYAQSPSQPSTSGFKHVDEPVSGGYTVDSGTRILLSMINSVSTKHAALGDRIYLETSFPVLTNGKIVIPQGSWVQGTVTEIKRPGRVKGKGEMAVRFDSLTLPNGITRDFRSRIGSIDSRSSEELTKDEGKIKGQGNKSGDLSTIAKTTSAGAGLGTLGGIGNGHYGMGAGIGAGAGAAAGLIGVLLSRGPDAMLVKGSSMEMLLDRQLVFTADEIDFSHAAPRGSNSNSDGPMQAPAKPQRRRFPL